MHNLLITHVYHCLPLVWASIDSGYTVNYNNTPIFYQNVATILVIKIYRFVIAHSWKCDTSMTLSRLTTVEYGLFKI